MDKCKFNIGDEVCVGSESHLIGNVVEASYLNEWGWVIDIKVTYFYSNREERDIASGVGVMTFNESDLRLTAQHIRNDKLNKLGL